MRLAGATLYCAAALYPASAAGPSIAGCPVFPPDNIWNTPITSAPVHARSDAFVTSIGGELPLHPDFAARQHRGVPSGIPFLVVGQQQANVPIFLTSPAENDAGPAPIPLDAPIEGGPQATGDRHVIAIMPSTCTLYELFRAFPSPGEGWQASGFARFDLRSNRLRPAGWSSVDAAGLPIFPGLVRYDEVASGEILHALRFTARRSHGSYVWPGRHRASRETNESLPPLGQRFRLKTKVNLTGFGAEARVILTALQRYGMIFADHGGPWFLSGAPDPRWNDGVLEELKRIRGTDFEAVDISVWQGEPDSAKVFPR